MNYMKFIKFCPISFSIIFVWNMISLNGYDINIEKHKEILADLPKAEDLDNYVISLDRTLGYCLKHKNYMDSDLFLGLFILAGKTGNKGESASIIKKMNKYYEDLHEYFITKLLDDMIHIL
ncbi:hypothetical protein HF086_012507 [Spodoptera exigua]|uniref:Uncharacterized protein n=1 Tax=Spodoptera exigua TaxID=7107 RepID=A0A922N211_SPOEX|nr:hypothetical protein HF086_012507 [Spodoptera exigua]